MADVKEQAAELPNFRPRLIGIILVAAAIALGGVYLVSRYVALDVARDLRFWQDKMNLIVDSRADEVQGWVDAHFRELKKLSENPSLQLYFTELQRSGAENAAMEPPQKTYLRNLLIFTADRMGFAPPSVPASLQIPAQIPFQSDSGLAILDNNNANVVSTPYLTGLPEPVMAQLRNLPPATQTLLDMQKGDEGGPRIGFVVPIYAIQSDPSAASQVGRVLGLKHVDDAFYKLLRHPGVTEKTMEAILVRKDGDNLVYLSPLLDGTPAMEKQLVSKPDELAEAYALENPNAFVEARDYRSQRVLVTSREIAGTPWTLVLKIDREEAFADSRVRRNGIIALLCAVVGLMVVVVIAVWYQASSRRAVLMSDHFRDLAEKSTAQERLLKLVTDNQPESLYILDRDQHYRFVNKQAAKKAAMNAEDMIGKNIADVLGAAKSHDTQENSKVAVSQGVMMSRVTRRNDQGEESVIRSEYIPIDRIPLPRLGEPQPGVLVVEHDISGVVHERERRLRAQKQLTDTLIKLVDRRDPHAANHSLLVSTIAYETARGMDLDTLDAETARMAGSLMNIGKIIVPEQVLTRPEVLKEDEKKSVRESIYASAELIKDISFDGPVVESLKQSQEHWDGTGPLGLAGEGILMPARIIAAANAFVGMVSPRSYRNALSIENATKILQEQVDIQFDRKVVAALINYIENQGGREMVQHYTVDHPLRGVAMG